MRIALAQLNCVVGDIEGNTGRIIAALAEARQARADLVVFPELAVTGYPPEDLLLKPKFIADNLKAVKEIAARTKGIAVYVGFVDKKNGAMFNAGAFIADRKIKAVYHKINLPNYAVFDEKRYFQAGQKPVTVVWRGQKIGLGICEDLWVEQKKYPRGLDLLLNINASPYHLGKLAERQKIVQRRAKQFKGAVIYVNLVGGQDELVFDGGSMIADRQGKLVALAKQYQAELLVHDLGEKGIVNRPLGKLSEIYQALTLGVRDYILKNAFSGVVIGLSGGIDSALTLAIAVDALGSEAVRAVYMPSQYSAQQSGEDAAAVAANLGVKLDVIPINEVYAAYLRELVPHFAGRPANIAEENLQARVRGNYLMALSNKFGCLVLTTGNKSEMSTGYSTLYGDMAGGFAVLKDVPKTLVYRLVAWRNQQHEVIPDSIIKRPPTAELKPNQTDQDTLPPYEVLDKIMAFYVEKDLSVDQIIARGYPAATVNRVIKMIDRAEYKRRQSPPGPRITPRAFGKDWRIPITNWYNKAK